MEYQPGSLRLDVRELDHPGPLLGFVGDEVAKFGGRHRHWLEAKANKARLCQGIGKDGIDLLAEPLDNFARSIFWHADTLPAACLVAGYRFAQGRGIRQQIQAGRGGDCQGAQLTLSDWPDRLGYRSKRGLHLSAEQIG